MFKIIAILVFMTVVSGVLHTINKKSKGYRIRPIEIKTYKVNDYQIKNRA